MHLIYIDDSKDEQCCIFSALAIPAHKWRMAFQMIKAYRKQLKVNDSIYVNAEFHAWKFVSGRGNISKNIVTKWRRCEIFKESLSLVCSLPGAKLFNAKFPLREEFRAFEWLLNRINRAMQVWNSHALLICDQGKEANKADPEGIIRGKQKAGPTSTSLGGFGPAPDYSNIQ